MGLIWITDGKPKTGPVTVTVTKGRTAKGNTSMLRFNVGSDLLSGKDAFIGDSLKPSKGIAVKIPSPASSKSRIK